MAVYTLYAKRQFILLIPTRWHYSWRYSVRQQSALCVSIHFLPGRFIISKLNPICRLNARKDLRDETISLSLGSQPNPPSAHRGANFNVSIHINFSAASFVIEKNTQQVLSIEMSTTKETFDEPYSCPILAQKRIQNGPSEEYHFCDRV